MLEDVPAIDQDALLETVIPETLASTWPLPVFDNRGELIGHLSRQTVAKILSETGKNVTETLSAPPTPESELMTLMRPTYWGALCVSHQSSALTQLTD